MTRPQLLATIDASKAAARDRDDCDPRKGFNSRSELSEEQWPAYRAEYEATFVRMTCEVTA